MNAMTEAFIAAGAKAPTIAQRVWRIIKDEPGLTQSQMFKRLPAIAKGSISSQLHLMEKRGMVYVKGTKGGGPTGTSKAYYTDLDHYERLPLPKGNGKTAEPAPAPALGLAPPTTAKKFDLDGLTIGEARALYKQLKEMFG
jgi:hypothetical protein